MRIRCKLLSNFDKILRMEQVTESSSRKKTHINHADHRSDTTGMTERGSWGGQIEFLLTIIGYAVGLGNVWRFPYLCYKNGGGAFLIPYFIMLVFCGIPIFFFELSFGQFTSLGPLGIWTLSPIFKGAGIAMVVMSIMIALYYNILVAYIIYFLFASMNSPLPWANCNNPWNTKFCLTASELRNQSIVNYTMATLNITRKEIQSPSAEYFYREVLKISTGIHDAGPVVWQLALCLLLGWIVIFLVLVKGVRSLGKVVYVSTIFPYVMMTVMVIRGVTLPGAGKGLIFYLKPDLKKLGDAEVWSDAAVQIFYSLSTCYGGLIAMASYNKFHNNTLRDSIVVPIINCVTSIFAGFAIFSVLGYMAQQKGVDVKDVATSGPGLVFVVYPEGLTQMPVSTLWSILFFLMMLFLGFSSSFSIAECGFVAVMDEFPKIFRKNHLRPVLLRLVTMIFYFLISLPMVTRGGFYLFTLCDTYAGGFPRLFIGLFELIAAIWVYGYRKFAKDIEMMIGRPPGIFFRATWSLITPLLIIGIVVFKAVQYKTPTLGQYVYPKWAEMLGWFMVVGVVIWIPVYFIGYWMYKGGFKAMKNASKQLKEWGPAAEEDRTGVYASNHMTEITWPSIDKNEMQMTSDLPGSYRKTGGSHDNKSYVE